MGASIWFLIMITVGGDGVRSAIFPAPKYEYNNQQACLAAGKQLSAELLKSDDKIKVFYDCQEVKTEKLMKALPKA